MQKLIIYSDLTPQKELRYCDMTRLKISYVKSGAIYENRIKIDGGITVFSLDYDYIMQIANSERFVNYDYYINGDVISSGRIDLYAKRQIDFKKISLSLGPTDKYSNFDNKRQEYYNMLRVLRNYWVDENSYAQYVKLIIENAFELVLVQIPDGIYEGVVTYEPVTNKPTGTLIEDNNPDSTVYTIFSINNSYLFGVLNECANFYYASLKGYGYYTGEGSEKVAQPPSSGSWYYQFDTVINGIQIPVFYAPLPDGNYSAIIEGGAIKSKSVFTDNNRNDYNNWRYFEDVIKFVVNNIDSSIVFNTDSFSFFENYESFDVSAGDFSYNLDGNDPLNFTYLPTVTSNNPYKDMVIMPLSVAIPNDDGTEKENEGTYAKINFEVIEQFLYSRGFVWTLENNVFIIKHIKDINQSNQNYYIDSRHLKEISYNEAKYNRLHSTEIGASLEFVGIDATFPNVIDDNTEDWGQNQIICDIDDIRTQKAAAYSDTDNSLFVVMCTIKDASNNVLHSRRATSELTSIKRNNYEHSFTFLSNNLICYLPDEKAIINGIQTIVSESRLQKNNKIKVETQKFAVDLTKNIIFANRNCEIEDYSYNGVSNFAQMGLIY